MEIEKEEEKPRSEMIRQLIELAVRSGRNRQSKQTGYVHYCYHPADEEKHDTIPLAENMLFALALFHSRTSDTIIEARGIIDRLLHFQHNDGNFPVYLHEFPNCRDRFIGAHMLPALYWIQKIFHTVVGSDLLPRLKKSSEALLRFCLKIYQNKTGPYQLNLKIASSAIGFGQMWQMTDLVEAGNSILNDIKASEDRSAWNCPAALADILVSLQMILETAVQDDKVMQGFKSESFVMVGDHSQLVKAPTIASDYGLKDCVNLSPSTAVSRMIYPPIVDSPWKDFWSHIKTTWHHSTCSFTGVPLREFQLGFEPQPTLYDLYLGYFSGQFSQRALTDHPYQLQAALIRPTTDRIILETSYPIHSSGVIDGCRWHLHQDEKTTYSIMEQSEPGRECPDKGRHIMRLSWGNQKKIHTFVCQGGNSSHTSFKEREGGIDLYFELNELMPFEDREKSREIIFFFDMPENLQMHVRGVQSNTFHPNDTVEIHAEGLEIKMRFIVEKGEGQFFGHIMPGNRLSQLALKGENRFKAYDWQIFLRTLSRSEHCKVKVECDFSNN